MSYNYAFSCYIRGISGGTACPTGGPAYLYSEGQEDSINFFQTNGFVAQGNWIEGGHSWSGCGLIADHAANSGRFLNNVLYNTGGCGIGTATGTNQTVSGNKALNITPASNGGAGMYVHNYAGGACGPVTVTNNISTQIASPPCDPSTQTCSVLGYADNGSCGTTTFSGNTFDGTTNTYTSYPPPGGPAFQALYPITNTSSPPLIPPMPKNCVATSPYSTQTSAPGCN